MGFSIRKRFYHKHLQKPRQVGNKLTPLKVNAVSAVAEAIINANYLVYKNDFLIFKI
jgi:hypothetical protein